MDWVKRMEADFKAMQERDQQAKRDGELEGRYIQEQIADGYAYYVIIETEGEGLMGMARVGTCGDLRCLYGSNDRVNGSRGSSQVREREHSRSG